MAKSTIKEKLSEILSIREGKNVASNTSSTVEKKEIILDKKLDGILSFFKKDLYYIDSSYSSSIDCLIEAYNSYMLAFIVNPNNDLFDMTIPTLNHSGVFNGMANSMVYAPNAKMFINSKLKNTSINIKKYNDLDICEINDQTFIRHVNGFDRLQVQLFQRFQGQKSIATTDIIGAKTSGGPLKAMKTTFAKSIADTLKTFNVKEYLNTLLDILKKSPLNMDIAINPNNKWVEGYIDSAYVYKRLIDSHETLASMDAFFVASSVDISEKLAKNKVYTIHNSANLINALEVFLAKCDNPLSAFIGMGNSKETLVASLNFCYTDTDMNLETHLQLCFKAKDITINTAIFEFIKSKDIQYVDIEAKITDIGAADRLSVVNKKNNANKLVFSNNTTAFEVPIRATMPSTNIDEHVLEGPLVWDIFYNIQKQQHGKLMFATTKSGNKEFFNCIGINIGKIFYLFYDYKAVNEVIKNDKNI